MIISKLHYTKLQRQLIFLLPLFFCVEVASAQIADDDWLIVSGGGQTKEQIRPEIDHVLEATTVEAERITGVRGKYAEAEGDAVIIRGVQELRGNYLFYDQAFIESTVVRAEVKTAFEKVILGTLEGTTKQEIINYCTMCNQCNKHTSC